VAQEGEVVIAQGTHTGRHIDVHDTALYVQQFGEGYPVVLLHGGLASSAMWAAVIPFLQDRYQVVTIDSRGHGRSENSSGELSTALMADDVAAIIHALRLDPPTIVGWSNGGGVALNVGFRHPDIARSFVVGAALDADHMPAFHDVVRRMLGINDLGEVDAVFIDPTPGTLPFRLKSMHHGGDEHWPTLVRQTATMWLADLGPTDEELRTIRPPTLVLGGDRDTLIPLDATLSLYRKLPDAELAICPFTGHLDVSSRAALLATIIGDFVDRHCETSAA
jgi:pimeloyl-ACP methyl ester carboxylesterase